MINRQFNTNNTGVEPWVLDNKEPTEMRIDIVEADGDAGRQTLGESDTYSLVLRDTPGQSLPDSVNRRYFELLRRGRYADRFEFQRTVNNKPTFTALWPDDSDSLVVSLEPTRPNRSSVQGVWGLIEDVEVDEYPVSPSGREPNWAKLSMTLVYLGHIDEYDDREELEDDLQNTAIL